MRKKALFLMACFLAVADISPRAYAVEDTALPEGRAEASEAVRYQRMMRDLDREYHRGQLTRTEYVQRKREIEKVYK